MRPTFSVIVPTHNREEQLAECLRALAAQSYPRDRFEVVVADDGSRRAPRDVIDAAAATLNITLIVRPAAGGPAAARNAAVATASGEFLAFTDDDCAPAADWLLRFEGRLAQTPTRLVGGRTVNALTSNVCSEASQMLIDIIYAYFNTGHRPVFFASNNFAMAADAYRSIGGFAPSFRFAEDREFCDRWLHRGGEMTYEPDAVVHHRHSLSVRTLWRQHFNYGRGAFLFHAVRAQRRWATQTIDPRFYATLFRHPMTTTRGARRWMMEALMCEMQLANAAGYFFQATKGAVSAIEPPPLPDDLPPVIDGARHVVRGRRELQEL